MVRERKVCITYVVCQVKVKRVKCGVVEGVERDTLRWFGHIERMEESEMTKRV